MGRSKGIPKYCKHKRSGKAYVTLNGKQIPLGHHGTKASRENYDQIIKEWLAAGRQLPHELQSTPITVNGLCLAFLENAAEYYVKNSRRTAEYDAYVSAARLLKESFGRIPAIEFSIANLKYLQKLADNDKKRNWCRRVVNKRITQIRRIFKWGAGESLIPAEIWQRLEVVEGLKKGRSHSKDKDPIEPVPADDLKKTLEHCSKIIGDMIRVQLLGGIRPGEVCSIRPTDIVRNGPVWIYEPWEFKTEHHDKKREAYFGPQAQKVLVSYLMDREETPELPLFSPKDATQAVLAAKRARRKTKVQPSQEDRSQPNPRRSPRDQYDTHSYRTAIHRACDKAGVPRWSPNQLRHVRGTEIRALYGLEASQVFLGHTKADVTEIYAERDRQLAMKIALETG